MKQTLREIEKFHGHLGPYAVIGYRMGKIACSKLNKDPFKRNVDVLTGLSPPVSCIVDGIQLSSGCTLGKGNIKVQDKKKPIAIFKDMDGKHISIKLKEKVQKEIDDTVNNKNIIEYSKKIYKKPKEKLFEIK